MKLLIIGGVAGGASAAARARRLDEQAEIVLVERGPDVSFANCGLPYYLGGEIAERGKLLVAKPEMLRRRLRIDVRTRTEALAIDRARHTVRLRDLDTGAERDEPYDRLILSPGAAPRRPGLPGDSLPSVHVLRNLEDTDRVFAALGRSPSHVAVFGGGFIGLEVAEALVHRGVRTTLVERGPQVLPPLDPEIALPVAAALRARGVELRLDDAATSFAEAGPGLRIALATGAELACDFALLGIGVHPENALAAAAGLEIGPRGGIRVDQAMRTSDPDIFAAGDAIETFDAVTGERTQTPLAGPANRQGRLAADAACGRAANFRGTQGTAIVRVFDIVAACTGHSEKALRRAGRAFRKAYVHGNHHAGYFPGAQPLSLKIVFDPADGRLLGAQGVGKDGVDKRIDVLATAIQARMTVYDLEQLELCYAPPFGAAKDPVNMAGFVAAGLLRGDHPQADWDAVLALPAERRPLLLDVRTPAEFAGGHIAGALNVPIDDLRDRLAELPRDRPIAAYCQVGYRGYLATRVLLHHGFEAVNLGGGYTTGSVFRELAERSR